MNDYDCIWLQHQGQPQTLKRKIPIAFLDTLMISANLPLERESEREIERERKRKRLFLSPVYGASSWWPRTLRQAGHTEGARIKCSMTKEHLLSSLISRQARYSKNDWFDNNANIYRYHSNSTILSFFFFWIPNICMASFYLFFRLCLASSLDEEGKGSFGGREAYH